MTRIIVDASVILSSLIADGPTRGILLGGYDFEFYSPEVVMDELVKRLPEVVRRSGKPAEVVEAIVRDILLRVEVVPTQLLALNLPSARRRAKRAQAEGDEAYIALAELLGAPIWTYDKDFRRVEGLEVLSTKDVRQMSRAPGPRKS